MKTTSFLMTLMVLVGTSVFAQEPADARLVVVNQKNPSSFKVIYKATEPGNIRMTIRDNKDQLVFAQTSRIEDGFIRRVNFAGMDYGVYTIEVAGRSGKQTNQVNYGVRKSIKSVHVAKMGEQGKYLLSVSNKGEEVINVRIFDGAYNLVHSQNMTINGDFGLVYDLRNIEGIPTFEVRDGAGNVKTLDGKY